MFSLSPSDAICTQRMFCSPLRVGTSPCVGEGQWQGCLEPATPAGFRHCCSIQAGCRCQDQQGQLHLTGRLLPFPSAQWSEDFTWWEALLATSKLWNIFECFHFQMAFLEQPAAGSIYFARGKHLHLWHRYNQSPMPWQGNLNSQQAFCHPLLQLNTLKKKKKIILIPLQSTQSCF